MKLILDVDTGIDDALAIAYAIGLKEAELAGVTCCFGNVRVEKAVENTLQILHLLGADHIPVYAGKNNVFSGNDFVPSEVCKRVHGVNGIGGIEVTGVRRQAETKDAVAFMAEMAEQYGNELIIVATAAMTNLARLIEQYPETAKKAGQIAFMGGALTVPGNVNRFAEANILADPEAAKFVLESGVPLTMIGLDVTLKTLMSAGEMERWIRPWREAGTEAGDKLAAMVHYYCSNEVGKEGKREGAIHDPLAVAAVLHPELVRTIALNLTAETDGESRGRTIGDLNRLRQQEKTVRVCVDVSVEPFMKDFVNTVKKTVVNHSF